MPDRDQVISVVSGWVQKAENDLTNATHTLKLGEDSPTDTVCFHAQQRAEKYIKAFLSWTGVDFPKIHDIEELGSLMPEGVRPGLSPAEMRRLTTYATATRYPGDYEAIPLAEARSAVALARRVRKDIRKALPKEALRHSRKAKRHR